jgi:hypothetical protein
MLLAHCNQVLSEHETKDLHDPGPSSWRRREAWLLPRF